MNDNCINIDSNYYESTRKQGKPGKQSKSGKQGKPGRRTKISVDISIDKERRFKILEKESYQKELNYLYFISYHSLYNDNDSRDDSEINEENIGEPNDGIFRARGCIYVIHENWYP